METVFNGSEAGSLSQSFIQTNLPGENLHDSDAVIPNLAEHEHRNHSRSRKSSQRNRRCFRTSNASTPRPGPRWHRRNMSGRAREANYYKGINGDQGWAAVAKAFDDYDRTVIATGKDSIDSLLVFAGLFSAVLTAFNIVSYALLQPDPTDSTALILAQISQQLGNLSIDGQQITSVQSPYIQPNRFSVTTPYIVVNILWFSSLILSLMSASVGILVKQWLQEYAAMTSSQAKEHVCIRQYRFDGLDFWRVSAIMKLLPLLLQVSLFLFFIGLSTLLWTINTAVAAAVTVLIIIWLVFWATTIWLPVMYGDCPYRSAESSILFALIQIIKPSLHSAMRALYMHIDSPRSLELMLRRMMDRASRSYDSWREREKDIVQKDIIELSQRTIGCADEILMDESVLEVAARTYVESPDVDESIQRLLDLFLEVAERNADELQWWIPDGSRRTRSLVRIAIDVLKTIDSPFRELHVAPPTMDILDQDQDDLSRVQRRELLAVVLGKYLYQFIGHHDAKEAVQDILDLPLYVDFEGLSFSTLRVFMMGLWDARLSGLDIAVEVVDDMAGCAVRTYYSPHWNVQDSDKFASVCMYAMRVITHTTPANITSASGPDPLHQFKELPNALCKFLEHLRENPTGLQHSNILSYLCEDLYALVKAHPVFMPDFQHCITALVALHMHPHPNMPTPNFSYYGRSQRHSDTLHALCDLYHIPRPPHFRLLSRFYNLPNPAEGTEVLQS